MTSSDDLPPALDPAGVTTLAMGHPSAPAIMDDEAMMRVELEGLRERHRDLDIAIQALSERGSDPFAVRRLKKRKLLLRDRIADLEDRLTPDIIA
jgi:hypothetical protein